MKLARVVGNVTSTINTPRKSPKTSVAATAMTTIGSLDASSTYTGLIYLFPRRT